RCPRPPADWNAQNDDRRRRSHNSAQRFLRRAGESADGFEGQCDRHRLVGRHRRRLFAPGSYLRSSYTILTADNRRTGRFEDLETFGLPRNFRARLDYFTTTLDLTLRPHPIAHGL